MAKFIIDRVTNRNNLLDIKVMSEVRQITEIESINDFETALLNRIRRLNTGNNLLAQFLYECAATKTQLNVYKLSVKAERKYLLVKIYEDLTIKEKTAID